MRDIEHICATTRKALEPGMPNVNGRPDSEGTCLYASFLLKVALEKFADCAVKVCGGGGDGCGDGGALDIDGVWRGHYWVEGQTFLGRSFVADIAADQFGFPDVVVLPIQLARDRYRPGAQAEVDRAVADLAKEMSELEMKGGE